MGEHSYHISPAYTVLICTNSVVIGVGFFCEPVRLDPTHTIQHANIASSSHIRHDGPHLDTEPLFKIPHEELR